MDVSLEGMAPFQPESLLGTVVGGRYRLSGHLASGGMSAVYVAEDTRHRREVALKLLQPHLAGSPEAVRRFLCEGAIAGMIDHANVVRILDHGGEDGSCFIAMELLDGEGLFDRLRREGALPPAEVVAILVQVCNGLEAAHRQGVVHRDLKPENVFLGARTRTGGEDPRLRGGRRRARRGRATPGWWWARRSTSPRSRPSARPSTPAPTSTRWA